MADRDASPPSNTLHPRKPGKQPDETASTSRADDGPSEIQLLRSNHAKDDDKRHSKVLRSHRHRSSGAFLLPDALHADDKTHTHRRHRIAAESHVTKSRSATPEMTQSNGTSSGSHTLTPESTSKRSAQTSETMGGVVAAQRDSLADATTLDGSQRSSVAPLDMDSAQIVNMALNLSESRRLAARRNISSPLPPRLAPLPDSAAGGSLRQHLQQQRRVSRNISPRPGGLPRAASGQKVASPLQPGFDQEGSYRYHFSQSTLSRAQKAKDHLELLAQYRKVLELVPPLTPDTSRRPSTASPPVSPTASQSISRTTTTSVDFGKLGRAYNPLQYIRNRKVRARERRTIDGEAQGFNDVERVTDWVGEAAKSVASGHVTESGSTLAPFNTPDEVANDGTQTSPRPVVTVSKPKRPRVDWVIDPADMLADVYWLEQGSNKKLVEDRHWKRVFPQNSPVYRPMSRQMEDHNTLTAPSSSLQDAPGLRVETDPIGLGHKLSKGEHDHVHGSARERAQQKLQAIKGLHHRHNSSVHHHNRDFLHSRNGSLSDSSDTDSDRKERSRGGTIGSSGKEILEKQMMEMIAREQREKELEAQLGEEARRQRSLTVESVAPTGDSVVDSAVHSRAPSHVRQGSVADLNEAHRARDNLKARPHPASPIRNGRASLEVPSSGRRLSIDYDTSYPASPEFKPTRGTGLVPAIGRDWSPVPSRATSPSRNPLSKVKSIFRDRSRERTAEAHEERGAPAGANAALVEVPINLPTDQARRRSTERRTSRSPIRKVISKGSESGNRSPRNHGSLRLRGDEHSSGLRGLLKAPRIDNVLRSGVSKVSDLIWRKEPDAADPHSESTSDESDGEPGRGRTRDSALQQEQTGGKTYLNVMPSFVPASESHPRLPQGDQGLLYPAHPGSRPPSRRPSRFELLQPPKIDVQDTTARSFPPAQKVRSHNGSETSDPDSRKSSHADHVRAADARLNAVISLPKPQNLSATTPAQRHWSISDGRTASVHATVSKSEIARLRALVLSSGIMAKEIDRRAQAPRVLGSTNRPLVPSSHRPSTTLSQSSPPSSPSAPLAPATSWSEIAALHPYPQARAALLSRPVSQTDLFPTAARTLGAAIEKAGSEWQAASMAFESETAPRLHRQVEEARSTVAGRLSDLTRAAADEADEVSLDLGQGQRLKVKRVVDVIEKMLRRRRRRFRWVRRGLWLGVEWVLVGFMWYVWFVVVIARMVLGVGKGILGAVRWVLWL